MKAKSAKSKGRRLENWLVDYFRDLDPVAHRVVGSGSGKNKGDVQLPTLRVALEAKNQKTYAMGRWLKDLRDERMANDMVALVFRDPDSPEANPECYATLPLADYHALLRDRNRTASDDRLPAWLVRRIIEMLKQLLKYLE